MPTINQIIHRLLPAGTTISQAPEAPFEASWTVCPFFAPDLFAVVATLVNLSGCYAHPAVNDDESGHGTILEDGPDAQPDYALRVAELGAIWANDKRTDADKRRLRKQLDFLWKELTGAGADEVAQPLPDELPRHWAAAIELLAVADRASKGVGFINPSAEMSKLMVKRHYHWAEEDKTSPLMGLNKSQRRRLTSTLCLLVPPEECCVQPKGRTPQVGCTLRSLSHNLALLPPAGEVTTCYRARAQPIERSTANVLLVPFPYAIGDGDISFHVIEIDEGLGRFTMRRQSWMPSADTAATATLFADFLDGLVDAAQKSSGEPVHAVVLPEQSLSLEVADKVAAILAAKQKSLEAFIAGVLVEPAGKRRLPGNRVLVRLFHEGVTKGYWQQPKHHRWRLTDQQAASYGFKPDVPDLSWWEGIDVTNRQVYVGQLHTGGIFTCLVCEDLARIEPVHSIVRAIGPSLIVALLFDGPQLKTRWAAHAMAGLVEDPGASVLSLTSLAPAYRWWENKRDRAAAMDGVQVGLWRDCTMADAEELKLKKGQHALLLPLKMKYVTERTLDRRSDDGNAQVVTKRSAVLPIAHPAPPTWLTMPPWSLDHP